MERVAQLLADGVIVVENVVPIDLCEAVVAATASFLGIDADDPDSWRGRVGHGHGIVPLHHHPALWNLRQWPGIHELFAELYGQDALWVSMDRVSFKPSGTGGEEPRMSGFHWDADPRKTPDRSFQGLVYLRDTAPEQGAFCCLPEVFANLDDWLAGRSRTAVRTDLNSSRERALAVGGPAGSMVVWHRRMPHSSMPNRAAEPRWVQYVTMDPAADDAARADRVRLFNERRPPEWAVRQRVPGQFNPEPGPTAELTPLGRRLVGLAA